MSQIELPLGPNIDNNTNLPKVVKHCRSCWRDDYHEIVPISPFMLGFLAVFSLGLVFLIRPCRCICCGHLRIR